MALRLDEISNGDGVYPGSPGAMTSNSTITHIKPRQSNPGIEELRLLFEASGLSRVLNGQLDAALEQDTGPSVNVESVLTRIFPGRGVARVLAEKLLIKPIPQLSFQEKFVLLGTLGKGGQGVARLAIDMRSQQPVVIKSTQVPQKNLNELQAGRFDRECKILRKLDGVCAPKIIEQGVSDGDDGYPYLAMELVKGFPLDKVHEAHEGPWPEDSAVALIRQIAVSLRHVHGVIRGPHRDIKPANVIIGDDGKVTIIDFGLAALAEAESTLDPTTCDLIRRLTQSEDVFGTPQYMSPEQAGDASKVGIPADVYSLGVMLYELLTHKNPFAGVTVQQTWSLHGSFMPDLTHIRNKRLANVIGKMIAKKPEDRYQTMEQVEQALAGAGRKTTGTFHIGTKSPDADAPIFSDHASPQTMVQAIVRENGRPDLALGNPSVLRQIGTVMSKVRGHARAIGFTAATLVAGVAGTWMAVGNSHDPADTSTPGIVAPEEKKPPEVPLEQRLHAEGKYLFGLDIDEQEGLKFIEFPNGLRLESDRFVHVFGHSKEASADPQYLGSFTEFDRDEMLVLFGFIKSGEKITPDLYAKLPVPAPLRVQIPSVIVPGKGRVTQVDVAYVGVFIPQGTSAEDPKKTVTEFYSATPGTEKRLQGVVDPMYAPVRAADQSLYLDGVRGAMESYGEMVELYPIVGAQYRPVRVPAQDVPKKMADYQKILLKRAKGLADGTIK